MNVETGKPNFEGRYVGYIEGVLGWLQPQILTWSKGAWHFHLSSQRVDCEVFGWVGPLPVLQKPGSKTAEPSTEYDL